MTEHLTYTVKAYDWATKRSTTVVCADYAVARKTAHGLGHQTKVVGFNRRVVRAVPTREVAIFHSGREVVRYVGGAMVTESTLAAARREAQAPALHVLDEETVAALKAEAKAAEARFDVLEEEAKKAKRSAAAKKAAATRRRNRELAARLTNNTLCLKGATA